jgi:hypothetical protein
MLISPQIAQQQSSAAELVAGSDLSEEVCNKASNPLGLAAVQAARSLFRQEEG